MVAKSKEKCLCEPTEVLIFPCSGGSNVGQIANESAKDLTNLKKGKMYCLAGIGGHVNGIIESTREAKKIIAIDGCPVQCAKKTLAHSGFKPDVEIVCTKLGIKKDSDLNTQLNDVRTIVEATLAEL
jgi:uncharacterized metal-binding protein